MKPCNIMEVVVEREIESNKDALHLTCQCDHCLADVLAISLNELKPKYIVKEDLEPYIRVKYEMLQQGRAEVLATISRAAKLVSGNPRCGNVTK